MVKYSAIVQKVYAILNAIDVSISSSIYYGLQRLTLFNTINTQNDSHIMVTVVIVI